VTSVIGTKS